MSWLLNYSTVKFKILSRSIPNKFFGLVSSLEPIFISYLSTINWIWRNGTKNQIRVTMWQIRPRRTFIPPLSGYPDMISKKVKNQLDLTKKFVKQKWLGIVWNFIKHFHSDQKIIFVDAGAVLNRPISPFYLLFLRYLEKLS